MVYTAVCSRLYDYFARPRQGHHPTPRWQNLLLLSSNPRSTRNLEEFLNRLKTSARKSAKRRKCVAQKRSKRITGQPMPIWFMLRVFLSHYCTLLGNFFLLFFFLRLGIPFCLSIYFYALTIVEVVHLFLFANMLKYWSLFEYLLV